MSALERALLALDLGERFGTFAKPRSRPAAAVSAASRARHPAR